MSKHLPNCPHLSKYDGLGDAGMIMAINEKHRKNDSYSYQDDTIDYMDRLMDTTEKCFSEMDDYVADVDRYVNEVNAYIQNLKEENDKRCRECYIAGYKQAKKDIKHKRYRNPYSAWIEYWES